MMFVAAMCVGLCVSSVPAFAGVPMIHGQFASNVSLDSAELVAHINPEASDTAYFFQFGTATTYAGGDLPSSVGVDIGEGEVDREVRVALHGLASGVTYHYRVVISYIENGEAHIVYGLDQRFNTFSARMDALPDNRAWERVSPLEKNSGDIGTIASTSGGGVVQASPDGDKITYQSLASFGSGEGAAVGSQYLSSRDATGWSTENITTALKAGSYSLPGGTPYKAFSADLSEGLFPNGESQGRLENPPLGGAPAFYKNYYIRALGDGGVQALLTTTPEVPASNFAMVFQGATPDLKRVVVSSPAALTPGATTSGFKTNLYEWLHGEFQAINVPPSPVVPGETTVEAVLGSGVEPPTSGISNESHTISTDGSRVFWSSPPPEVHLYVRENIGTPQARTVALDESPQVGGHGIFLTASADGSRAFFTNGSDLFEYNVETAETLDLAPGGEILGVLGASEDGSYIYFVGNGAVATGASQGDCQAGNASTSCNLYVWHAGPAGHEAEGTTKFIATLSGADEEFGTAVPRGAHDWAYPVWERTARVSPDGQAAVYMSGVGPAALGMQQVYVYETSTATPVCVSCNASGEAPSGASSIPGGTPFAADDAIYDSRVLSDGGDRVFFDSLDGLVPGDTNGKQDIYEWERAGAGDCSIASAGGCVNLLSSGRDSEDASFVDASSNGSDAFFVTRAELVPEDSDQLVDLYDARVDGKVAVDVEAPAPCVGEGCKGAIVLAPAFAVPGSMTFSGVGNFAPPLAKAVSKAKKKKTKARKTTKKKKKSKARKARTGSRARKVRRVERALRTEKSIRRGK